MCWCINASMCAPKYLCNLFTSCMQSTGYSWKSSNTSNLFLPRTNSNFMKRNIALFRFYFIECITFKLEDSKKCRHLQKEIFWIFITTTKTLLNTFFVYFSIPFKTCCVSVYVVWMQVNREWNYIWQELLLWNRDSILYKWRHQVPWALSPWGPKYRLQ